MNYILLMKDDAGGMPDPDLRGLLVRHPTRERSNFRQKGIAALLQYGFCRFERKSCEPLAPKTLRCNFPVLLPLPKTRPESKGQLCESGVELNRHLQALRAL